MKSDFDDELSFSAAFPLPFRVLFLVALGILGWAANLHGLHLWGIDAAGVLDLSPYETGSGGAYRLTSPLPTAERRKAAPSSSSSSSPSGGGAPHHLPVYRLAGWFAGWAGGAWALYAYATGAGAVDAVDAYKFVPGVAALVALTALACPLRVLHKAQRDKFLTAIHRCVFPSPHGVYFSDVVFADILTSFAKVLGDVWLSVYMLLPGGSLLAQPAQDGLTRWVLPTIMSLPYAIRLRQCLVEYNSPSNTSRRPLYNALKYASSFPVIFLSAAQRIVAADEAWHGEHHLFRLWLLAAAVNSLYSFWWDRSGAASPDVSVRLRPTLLYPLAVYPLAILVDLILRLTWSASWRPDHLWIELAEVVRRWMWVFLRVEWETVKEARPTRSPPPGPRSAGLAADPSEGEAIALECRESYRDPIFETDEFEAVPSERIGPK
ncbi:EXS-domain-containing protein [Epithele typhae]|uniref:EXS-domain-containing protein n=1 Tax=Epithele typhae TaxID=378194 RepID=UPI0020080558|nr:EXS-domain-containing protein [Epithele typhae]KAH9931084.1 EXS-domain-containing protein [Epithele typhae]